MNEQKEDNYKMRIILTILLFNIALFLNAQAKIISADTNKSRALFPGDILKITVVDHKELSLEVSVDSKGLFNYPYCGQIEVKNKTIGDISKEISEKLAKKDFNNVQVSIFVKGSRYVYVFGEVSKPLAVEMKNGMTLTLIQAISAAGMVV